MIKAKKDLGQNFLVDQVALNKIFELINPKNTDHFLEIGPGKGALTKILAKDARRLDAVELDKDLLLSLKLINSENLYIHNANILNFFDILSAFFGPIFGVVVADYYFIKKQKINHKELFYPKENSEYIYSSGWNYKAIYSLIIGFIFSVSVIWNTNLDSLQSFGWIIGAFVSYIIYYLLSKK